MAISPPSDILLDVAGAADPAKVREATARLAKLAADPAAANTGFSSALTAAKVGMQAAGRPTTGLSGLSTMTGLKQHVAGASVVRAETGGPHKTYQKFEAVLLQNFVESMLPKDDDLYGDKNSAGVYRSMMAEQLADEISKAGGFGIATSIEKAHPAPANPRDHAAQKPAVRPA